jgi:hypothetical protein
MEQKLCLTFLKNPYYEARHWWLTPVILATLETETRRIKVQSQHRQISSQDPIMKIPNTKRVVGVGQGIGPEFKPQYRQTNKKNREHKIWHFSCF